MLPWRAGGALERWTVACGYPRVPTPFTLQLRPDPPSAWLMFGGDVALDRWQPATNSNQPFTGLAAAMRSADVRIVNLEAQFTSLTTPAGIIGTSLRAEPAALDALSYLGIDAVTCANNHCLDFGPEALSESVTSLRSRGIAVTGVNEPERPGSAIVVARGIRIGMLGFTDDWRSAGSISGAPRPLAHDEALVRSSIVALKPRCDILVVQLHWGYEWSMYPMRTMRDLARSYIDSGADIVVCHHAHVPMGVETWRHGIVAHGLGNLYFGRPSPEGHPFRATSFLLRAGVSKSAVVRAEIIPVRTDANGNVGEATGDAAEAIHSAIGYLSSRLSGNYAEEVEAGQLANAGCQLLLDLERRISVADTRGVSERIHGLAPPRQRWMIARLRGAGGVLSQVGSTLDDVRLGRPDGVAASLTRELIRLAPLARQWVARHRQKGRIP